VLFQKADDYWQVALERAERMGGAVAHAKRHLRHRRRDLGASKPKSGLTKDVTSWTNMMTSGGSSIMHWPLAFCLQVHQVSLDFQPFLIRRDDTNYPGERTPHG
jgi:hypothetical protein